MTVTTDLSAGRLPAPVAEILRQLNRTGHEAYVVGGCVRDAFENGDEQAREQKIDEIIKLIDK